MPTPICLTIAGSDPSGGAGIQGDLKTFSALGAYGMAVPTAITVQNSQGVHYMEPLSGKLVAQQIQALLEDAHIEAIKLGMLATGDVASAVAQTLSLSKIPLVIDPIVRSSSGAPLLDKEGIKALIAELLPQCTIVTPNVAEAEILLGHPIRTIDEIEAAGQELISLGARAVLITGGDFGAERAEVTDVLCIGGKPIRLVSRRIQSRNTHGTGCALTAALCVGLAQGMTVRQAVDFAGDFVRKCLQAPLEVGKGIWPVNHLRY